MFGLVAKNGGIERGNGARRGPKRPRISPAVRRFINRLKDELQPELVILFGSRARGENIETSDYDMLIVSKAFSDIPWVERAVLILPLWDIPLDLEPICLTPAEFKRRSNDLTIVGMAIREGIVIYP